MSLDPSYDMSRPLSASAPLWETPSLVPGDALGQGHFPEWNFLLLINFFPA